MDTAFGECSGKLPYGVNIIVVPVLSPIRMLLSLHWHFVHKNSNLVTFNPLFSKVSLKFEHFYIVIKYVKYYHEKFKNQSKTKLPKGIMLDI